MSALIGFAAKAAVIGSVAATGAPVPSPGVGVSSGSQFAVLTDITDVVSSVTSLPAAAALFAGQNSDLLRPGMRFTLPEEKLTAHAVNPSSYVVRNGDTLTAIAAKFKTPGGWESLFADNHSLSNPDVITVGMTLALPAHAMFRHYSAPVHYVPAAIPVAATPVVSPSVSSFAAPSSSTYHGSSSMEQCIIARESGGNSQIMNSSGHYGLYQFSESTWVASGGSAAAFGHASVAEQEQVFRNAVAARGYSDWAPYDGC